MHPRISVSVYGARAAKEMLYRIRRANSAKGEIDLEKAFSLLQKALDDPRSQRGVLLVLAEFISVALEGSALRLEDWTPLELFDPEAQTDSTVSPARLKRG